LWEQRKAESAKASAAGMKTLEPGPEPTLEEVIAEQGRERLLGIIRDLVRWENSRDGRVLQLRIRTGGPIASRARYHSAPAAKHCREYAPTDTDELHQVAGALMSSRRSKVLGWQLLYEARTGLRSEETVRLRLDARPNEAGGLTADGGSLCVRRAEKPKSYNPYVRVHEGLADVMAAHKIWLAKRYPSSPWCFPGRERDAHKHVDKSALTKALDRPHQVFLEFRKTESDPAKFPEQPHLTRKYTSHGAGRAFYVYARRCQGADDPQICYEINHTGGVGTLEQVYALPARHWKNGQALGMPWLPKGSPAWSRIKGLDFSALHVTTGVSYDI